MLQDDIIKEILKRAKNVKEVFFEFGVIPSMQIIEILPESLEHLPFLVLRDGEAYSEKFKQLKSLNLTDDRFDFKFRNIPKIKVFVYKKLEFHDLSCPVFVYF